MVAILEKTEHNGNFHPMVDFIEASPLRYALTVKSTVYVSHIRQFWSTARIETMDEETKILAIVDGIQRTVFESSLRRNLKLQDEEGISSLPDKELFENLTLMGYNISPNQKFTFQKGQFSRQWKYLIHTIMQCISPKSTGFNEFSSDIATALVCQATSRTYNFSKIIFDGLVKNVNNKISKFLMYPRFLAICLRMSQFAQITHTHTYVVHFHTRKLFTTLRVNNPSFSGRIVPLFDTMLVQQGEGLGTPTEPHHTPSPEAQSPSYTTPTSPTLPPITTTSIPTVTPSDTPIVRQYTRRTRIAQSFVPPTVADELASPLRDAQEVEINRLKERVKLLEDREGVTATRSRDDAIIKGRSMDEGETATERISDDSEEMVIVLTSMDAATVLASGVVNVPTGSGSILTASTPVEDQVPTGSDVVPTASIVFATTTVVTLYKRRKGKEVMMESKTLKKQKVQKQLDAQVARELEEQLERVDKRRSEQIAKDAEIARIHAEEELQIMIDGLDRNNETIAKYLQEYHLFALELPFERRIELITDLVKSNLDWKVKDSRGMTCEEFEAKFNSVWKQLKDFIPMGSKEETKRIKRKVSHEEVPEEKVKEMMLLVPIEEVYVEALQVKHPIIDWKKLYDICGVHHVTSKDKEIFMLVEKDYLLRKGLALVMISYKLQVENYSQMANDLILKIYKIANSPRHQGD
nr:hypothetical protein [Tanacetum cinerariifolium]